MHKLLTNLTPVISQSNQWQQFRQS